MDISDLESLLSPFADGEACGPDLEYDPDFSEMDLAAQGKPEQQYGDTVVAAEEPDWKEVRRRAESLLERTKDMRVVVFLARAYLHEEGLPKFAATLELLRGYVENFWDSVHPELDHDDNDDPTYRTNTLTTLCDDETTLRELRDAPLVSSRAVGRFSLREIERASESAEAPPKASSADPDDWGSDSNEETSSEPSGPSKATIDAAFTDSAIEEIQSIADATQAAADHLAAIETCVTEHVGITFAVSLAPARNILVEMNKIVSEQLQRRGVGVEEPAADATLADEGEFVAEAGEATVPGAAPVASGGYPANGKIATRQQAIKALEDVCDFYDINEPSSPLPLLIRRAQRLASASFLDILRDV
ncbi:MAG: type VI secretion system protein TssA, partial [Planctomycetota bacterium]